MKYVKTQLIQNRRLITGTAMAMAASVVYLAAGYLGGTVWSWGWMDLTAAGMLVSMVTLWGFGFWTVKSLPKYPTTKLEHQQVAIERAVLSEWGEAIGYLRLTIEKCEECSDRVIQHHRVRLMDDHVEPNLLQTLLIGMHAKACDLARVVADDCQRGHAEAAFATWRAIFEIQVNMAFIAADTTGETAKRFQDWSKASALRLYDPESDELKTLRKTYAGWEIDRDMGWTRKGYLMGIRTRARAIGYSDSPAVGETSILQIYQASNAYGHNDATGIFHDLGTNPPFVKGPSAAGLDMPLCLTSLSVATVTEILSKNQEDVHANDLEPHLRTVWARQSQVPLEVAMVPKDLLSRFGGFYVSRELNLDDGRQIIFIPARRGSSVEDAVEELERRSKPQHTPR